MSKHENINNALKDHQLLLQDWDLVDQMKLIHNFNELMILKFKLQLNGIPAIAIKRLRSKSFGHYMPGRNGFGLNHELAIDVRHFNSDPLGEVLGSLLHELLHFEQDILGTAGSHKNNYHNNAFRERAASFGLIVNAKGEQCYASPPTPFSEFLSEQGIEFPCHLIIDNLNGEDGLRPTRLDTSKIKLWVCGCTPKPVHVRVAIQDFRAQCMICGQLFTRL